MIEVTKVTKELLHHAPEWWSAFGTLMNVGLVLALAIINWRYLSAAKRQAEAAEEQTSEIKEQILLSREQLGVMQDAFRFSVARDRIDRRNDLTVAESELRKIDHVLGKLLNALNQPAPNFRDVTEDAIFPNAWIGIARTIEQEIAAGDQKARTLLSSLLTTKTAFRDLVERRRSAMRPDVAINLTEGMRGQTEASREKLTSTIDDVQVALNSLRSDEVNTENASR